MAWLLALTLGVASCQPEPTQATPSSAQPTAAGTPAPTDSAGAAPVHPLPSASPHAGTWSGALDTARGTVEVPKGVDYPTWSKDDGTERAGKGSIELSVAADGSVTGQASGALGELTVVGVVESGWLRASLLPTDPDAPSPMTGVLIGEVKGKQIVATLRVANHEGSVVRQAKVTLAPRP